MPAQALCRFKVGTLNVCTMKCRVKLEVVGEAWVFVSIIENTTYSLMAGLEMIERASTVYLKISMEYGYNLQPGEEFLAHLSRNDFDTKLY